MIIVDLLSIILRLAEMAFAAIVAGINGHYLHTLRHVDSRQLWRFIFTEAVAGLSILLAIVWLIPFSGSFIHWPADFVISVAWFVAFGLLVDWLDDNCGYIFDWGGISLDGTVSCTRWKTTIAFSFLSALCWLASTILGIYWVHRRRRTARVDGAYRRRRWYRSRI
ncbi:membrane-associating domain-containing protein [Staphylotrichum tortipilum]|uniref:Membrane-associating domain-containing protein n=1 Tax=Staphylotrichum tortipilum TaxID=2831512 RepID=A0AAN6MKS6_9PEZI|nr:membrane-associating domain-containing protein [Staphylotrichum longicolle]